MNKVASSAIGCFNWKKCRVITSFHLEHNQHKPAIYFKICKTCTAQPFYFFFNLIIPTLNCKILYIWQIKNEWMNINPLISPLIYHNLDSHLLSLYFFNRSSWENLLKYQSHSSSLIMYSILMTTLSYKALILQGEIWCWSLLGFKGLK